MTLIRLRQCAFAAVVLCTAATRVHAVDADYDVRAGDLVAPGQLATGLHVAYGWTLALNPGLQVKLAGAGGGRPELSLKTAVASAAD